MFRCFQPGKGGAYLQKPLQGDTFKRVNAHATYHLIPEQIQWLVDGLVNEKGLYPVLAKKKKLTQPEMKKSPQPKFSCYIDM